MSFYGSPDVAYEPAATFDARYDLHMSFLRFVAPLVVALTLIGCNPAVSVTVQAGESFQLSGSDLEIPDSLREETASGPVVRQIPCNDASQCSAGTSLTFSCEGVCNPSPTILELRLGVVDFEALAGDADRVLDQIDTAEVLSVEYQVMENSLNVPLENVRLYWGPEGAAEVNEEMGVRSFGTIEQLTGTGTINLDAVGQAALSAHIEDTSYRIRLFAAVDVDLEPGGVFPEGAANVSLRARVRLSGKLL